MASTQDKRELAEIGLKIRKFRLQKNISQAQVAFELGTSTKQFQRIEYGQINTGILNLIKIAKILDVDVKKLL